MSLWSRVKSAFSVGFIRQEDAPKMLRTHGSDAGEVVNEQTALGLSAFWGCVNLIAGTVGTMPVGIYRKVNGVLTEDTTHRLYYLLHDSPNYDHTAVDFWEFISASLETWGNAYARKQFNSMGVLNGLEPIDPAAVLARRRADGKIEYSWTADGKAHRGTEENVLHIRGFGGNALGGISTLAMARNALGLARGAERAAGSAFKNDLRPSGAMTFSEWLTPEQRELAETNMVEKYVGATNAGKPLILEGGMKWESISINPADAQTLETRKFSVEEICRFFGVPPHMIGHTEKASSWGKGLEQQTMGFLRYTLRRRIKRIEQALQKQLLTPAEVKQGVRIRFNFEALLRADSAGRAAFYQVMTQIGAMTINEVRALENLPAVDGGDVPRMQMQNVPIDHANPMEERGDD